MVYSLSPIISVQYFYHVCVLFIVNFSYNCLKLTQNENTGRVGQVALGFYSLGYIKAECNICF